MEEFSTLNGFKVKDATARENITQMQGDISELQGQVKTYTLSTNLEEGTENLTISLTQN